MTEAMDDLIPAAEAARLIQPHLPDRDAAAWLKDLRRSTPSYALIAPRPPFERQRGRILYRRGDIMELISRLGVAVARPHRVVGTKKAASSKLDEAPCVTRTFVNSRGEVAVEIQMTPYRWLAVAPADARRLAYELVAALHEAQRLLAA